MKADREDLIRANGCVAIVTIDHIEKTILDGIPERDVETPAGHPGHLPEEYRFDQCHRPGQRVCSITRKALYQSACISTGFPYLGVTTLSPTLASIQVSCTPGSPQESKPSLSI